MDLINKYFPGLPADKQQKLDSLFDLYKYWNERVNVISRKDIEQLNERHVLHSLSIAKAITFEPGTEILDVGTGGGFPGIPLAIMFPSCRFTLVDSIGKKIKVVNEISSSLELNNVKAIQARVETMNCKFDFIVSRAVTKLNEIYKWIKPLIKTSSNNSLSNGLLYLKGTDALDELKTMNVKHHEFYLKEMFTEEFFETKLLVHIPIKG